MLELRLWFLVYNQIFFMSFVCYLVALSWWFHIKWLALLVVFAWINFECYSQSKIGMFYFLMHCYWIIEISIILMLIKFIFLFQNHIINGLTLYYTKVIINRTMQQHLSRILFGSNFFFNSVNKCWWKCVICIILCSSMLNNWVTNI